MGKILSSLLGGVWGYVAAAGLAAVIAVGAVHYVDAAVYGKQIAELKLSQSQAETKSITASLTQLQGFIAQMHGASADYNGALATITADFAALKKEFADATRIPLPPDCRPDAGRLRVLTDAVQRANGAAKAGP